MSIQRFVTLADAYAAGLAQLLADGRRVPSVTDATSPASGFGNRDRPYTELIGHGFVVDDARASIIDSPVWQPRLDYYFGLWAWSLAGSNDVAPISYYHPKATAFSDDGAHLSGAFGHRLITAPARNQLEVVYDRLKDDPTTRRAAAVILQPQDLFRGSREVPCAVSAHHYFIRDGRLIAMTFMRAQHALFVLPYDAFLFMAFQQYLAARLGLPPGEYHHVSATFHIYDDELPLARAIVDSRPRPVLVGAPSSDPDTTLAQTLLLEEGLRVGTENVDDAAVIRTASQALSTPSDTLEGQAQHVFALKAARELGMRSLAEQSVASLPDAFRPLAQAMR